MLLPFNNLIFVNKLIMLILFIFVDPVGCAYESYFYDRKEIFIQLAVRVEC